MVGPIQIPPQHQHELVGLAAADRLSWVEMSRVLREPPGKVLPEETRPRRVTRAVVVAVEHPPLARLEQHLREEMVALAFRQTLRELR